VEAEESLRLDNAICKGLLKLSLEHDVTPFTLLLSVFVIILRKYTREVGNTPYPYPLSLILLSSL